MSTTTQTAAPDLAAVKARQQQVWASGDYAAVAARIVPMAEHLAEAAGLRPGDRVLDVATGSGNAAVAAARYGCEVIGVDYVPGLLERARARAAAEGLEITFAEGDAEELAYPDASFDAVLSCLGVMFAPDQERAAAEGLEITFAEGDAEELAYPDASFDAVLSCLGVMFAPDQERAAAELVRVCRHGGTIGLVNWTPGGFIGQLLKTVGKHVPPPAGVRPPSLWGTEERLRELFGDQVVGLEVTPRSYVFRFRSPEEFAGFFKDRYGPTHMAFEALDKAGQGRLWDDLTTLAREHDRSDDGLTVAMPTEYVEVVATRA
jgi:ubiquinone/menaquinone biosynthesis C-methylase UbiE